MANQLKRKLQIFISSTFTDLIRERQTAVSAILENGHIPAGMELFAAGDEEQMQVIRRWIDQSDIFLLVLGMRYGSVDPKSGKSYTQLEYEYAVSKKVPFFAIVLADSLINGRIKNGEKLEDLTEQVNPTKYIDFKRDVTSRMCSFAEDQKDIKLKIWQSIRDLESRYEFNGWVSPQSIPDNAKALGALANLTSEAHYLREENARLVKKLSTLEARAKQIDLYNGKSFDELSKILSQESVTLKDNNKKEVNLSLQEAFDLSSNILAGGVSNAATGSSDDEIQMFYKIATPLAVYGLTQHDKVPSKFRWKRFVLSELGKRFLAELRTRKNVKK